MSAGSMHTGAQSTSPLTDGICDDFAVQSHPFTTNFLLQFGDICYLITINPFLENAPNTVVNGFKSGEFGGQSEGSMDAGVSFFNSSIVTFARCAGVLSCWKTKQSSPEMCT